MCPRAIFRNKLVSVSVYILLCRQFSSILVCLRYFLTSIMHVFTDRVSYAKMPTNFPHRRVSIEV